MNVAISPNGAPDRRPARSLKVGGVTGFTATDFPGRLAAVVFTQGCPWRCGYCHNPHLQQRPALGELDWQQVLARLERRVGLLDGVVFSGGEPCMDPALADAIQDVRALGFQVGLHTGGAYPARLAAILPLLDWIGLDIKAPFGRYADITGVADSGAPARRGAEMVIASGVEYEMRTTLHPALLDEAAIEQLARALAAMGARHYALQVFRPLGCDSDALRAAALTDYPSEALRRRIAPLFARFTLRV